MARRIDYAGLVGHIYVSEAWGAYAVQQYYGRDDKKVHWYEITFRNSGNSYRCHYKEIVEQRVVDRITKKANAARVNAIRVKQRNRLSKEKQSEYKKFNFEGKVVLALDLSSTSTGYCILTENGIRKFGSITFVDHKSKTENDLAKCTRTTFVVEGKHSIEERFKIIFRHITELINDNKIDVVVMEDAHLVNVKVLKVLMQLQGYIVGHCLMNNIQYEKIMASSWQSYFELGTFREDLKRESITRVEKIVKEKVFEDTADAINIGIYAVKELRMCN